MPIFANKADLRKASDYKTVRGYCHQLQKDDCILEIHAFREVWERKIDRIDWAAGDYHVFFVCYADRPDLNYLHDSSLKIG